MHIQTSYDETTIGWGAWWLAFAWWSSGWRISIYSDGHARSYTWHVGTYGCVLHFNSDESLRALALLRRRGRRWYLDEMACTNETWNLL